MVANALLLSAYDAKSHKLWRLRLAQMFPEIHWTQLALPPRNFNWRIRGNSLHWAINNREELVESYDLLLATSMVDLTSLRGFLPQLASVPSIVYFHENQFAYPDNLQRQDNIEPLLVPLYSALCADRIVFNSKYNKESFIEGVRSLFKRLPDKIPNIAIEKLLASSVVPVPITIPGNAISRSASSDCLEVVWNHRWEYDKDPELLLAIVERITSAALPIRLHVVGESFRQIPDPFKQIEKLLIQHCRDMKIEAGAFGYIEDENKYYGLLASSDVVLSTALHDFQGLSMQEACFLGCTPLAPDNLVYPEYLTAEFLYQSLDTKTETAQTVVDRLSQWWEFKTKGDALPKADLHKYSAEELRSSYSELFGLTS
ncbi:MAG: DUF3524 domain-containing protein [Pseudomonadales bacterium]|nr:DUF3524 domain-containing protein [Pseudomonadales bacterium]